MRSSRRLSWSCWILGCASSAPQGCVGRSHPETKILQQEEADIDTSMPLGCAVANRRSRHAADEPPPLPVDKVGDTGGLMPTKFFVAEVTNKELLQGEYVQHDLTKCLGISS